MKLTVDLSPDEIQCGNTLSFAVKVEAEEAGEDAAREYGPTDGFGFKSA